MSMLIHSARAQAAHRSLREEEAINIYRSMDGPATLWVRSETEGPPPARCTHIERYRGGEQLWAIEESAR